MPAPKLSCSCWCSLRRRGVGGDGRPLLTRNANFAANITAEIADGEQIAEVLNLRVLLKSAEVRKRHSFLEFCHTGRSHFAVFDIFSIGQDVFGEQFRTRNLDAERLF